MIRLSFLLLCSLVTVSCTEERIPLMVQILDDQGNPVPAVPVTVAFNERSVPGGMFGRLVRDRETVLTDETGSAQIQIPIIENYNQAVFNTGKVKGYYSKSSWTYHVDLMREHSEGEIPVTISIPRVRNPIAPYAVSNWSWKLPEVPGPWGFDFFVADWVAPNGKGLHADVVISILDDKGEIMQWDFTGEHSGAILHTEHFFGGGALKSPYEGPEEGYQRSLKIEKSNIVDNNKLIKMRSWFYLLRIERPRTEGFYYGKSINAVDYQYFPQHNRGIIRWTYGFNPTPGERWIEFDRRKSASRKSLREIWGSYAGSSNTRMGP